MTELITLKFALICIPLVLILIIQLAFLVYVAKCKREINRLPYNSEEAEEVGERLYKVLRIYTPTILILLFLSAGILLLF